VFIIIATSLRRTNLLINKSLKSVYYQKKINSNLVNIIIVDDNRNNEEFLKVKNNVLKLRKKCRLKNTQFKTYLIKNKKTRFNSGTGAWNTAIDFIYKKCQNCYILFLDDDDWYDDFYLYNLKKHMNGKFLAIFSPIRWIFKNFYLDFKVTYRYLTPREFFIRNPGIQASNMCFRIDVLRNIKGFDEKLSSTTDRDLIIRFLQYCKSNNLHLKEVVKIIDYKGVFYNATNKSSITRNLKKKQRGLDVFYEKYKRDFSIEDLELSLKRAKKLFKYETR